MSSANTVLGWINAIWRGPVMLAVLLWFLLTAECLGASWHVRAINQSGTTFFLRLESWGNGHAVVEEEISPGEDWSYEITSISWTTYHEAKAYSGAGGTGSVLGSNWHAEANAPTDGDVVGVVRNSGLTFNWYDETDSGGSEFPDILTPSQAAMEDLLTAVAAVMALGVTSGGLIFCTAFLWRFYKNLLGAPTWSE